MTAEPPPTRLQIAQTLARHLGHRDFEKFTDLLSKDVTYRVGGNHELAGTFHGPDEVIGHVKALVEQTDNTYDTSKWEDWLVGEHHVAALIDIHAQGHGAIFKTRLVVLLAFDSADKIADITIFYEDLAGAERFFGR